VTAHPSCSAQGEPSVAAKVPGGDVQTGGRSLQGGRREGSAEGGSGEDTAPAGPGEEAAASGQTAKGETAGQAHTEPNVPVAGRSAGTAELSEVPQAASAPMVQEGTEGCGAPPGRLAMGQMPEAGPVRRRQVTPGATRAAGDGASRLCPFSRRQKREGLTPSRLSVARSGGKGGQASETSPLAAADMGFCPP